MSNKIIIAVIFLGLIVLPITSRAQVKVAGSPVSFDHPNLFQKALKSEKLPSVNMKRVRQEDADNPGNSRFTTPIPVDFTLDNSGEWTELEDGARIWRLKIESKEALALMALYDNFYLPKGAQLFMYNEDKTQVLGAYTYKNNSNSRKFMTGLIDGNTAIIEYYEPAKVRGMGSFRIFRVDHAYQPENLEGLKTELGFGAADICNLNVQCPQADPFRDQQRSVCRIYVVVEEGIGFCSGVVLNNTNEDNKPYVLSAYHCQDGFTPMYDMWRFDFNYEGAACLNPFTEPEYNSILGCVQRAGRQENDFLLLEMTSVIPNEYNVYLSGWDRTGVAPDSSYSIHHPRGDIKKFSLIHNQATIHPLPFNWDNGTTTPPNLNFRAIYSTGTFEGGSSGSPMLDKEGYVVGQLHGGFNYCQGSVAYFGRLSESWEGGGTPETRLKDWLDPEGTDEFMLNGMESEVGGEGRIEGYVTNEVGLGIAQAFVILSGDKDTTVITDQEGKYTFENLPYGGIYTIRVVKDVNYKNGVTTFDLVKITQHIIGLAALDSPYKIMAADVNLSGSISTLDMIFIRRLILSIDPAFDAVPSWRFIPFLFEFQGDDPFEEPFIPNAYQVDNFGVDISGLDFVGFKMGDVNNSADTEN